MVFYFQPRGFMEGSEDWLIYMGRDKYENEELIKYGLPHDVWFHVESLSSAHVYLRLPQGHPWTDIPSETLEDCVQLVKANSIQGSKQASVTVIYTPWSNLRKSANMVAGEVGFQDQKLVRKEVVPKKINEIINRLNRTKKECEPDLKGEQEAFEAEVRRKKNAEAHQRRLEEKATREEHKRQKELRSYKTLMQEENMVTSKQLGEKYENYDEYEEDFM